MKKPTLPNITGDELCLITGLTDRRHRQLAASGYYPPPVRGIYERQPTLLGIIRYQRELLHKKSDTLHQEQTALTKAKRERAELENEKFRGELVDKAEITTVFRNLLLNMRAALQRKFEQELGMNLQGLTTIEIRERIKASVDEYTAMFREGAKQWLEAPPPNPPTQ